MLKRHALLLTFALGLFDSLCALAAYALATYYAPLPEDMGSLAEAFRGRIAYFVLFVVVWCGAATDQRLFQSQRSEPLGVQMAITARAILFSLLLSGFTIVFLQRDFDREFLLIFACGTMAFILLFRVALRLFLWSVRRRGFNFRRIIIVGANDRARHFAEVILNKGQYGYILHGIIDDDESRMRYFEGMEVEYLGPIARLEELLAVEVIDEVYIALPVRSCYEDIQEAANLCEGIGVPVRLIADFFPLRIARSKVHLIEDIPFLSMTAVPEHPVQLAVKRLIDIAVSFTGLVVLVPTVFIPLAILIKLESKGPVFFAQERVGLNQRRFKMLKFRSMVSNAEALRKELEAKNEADGPVFKIKDDPRITRIGRFIRKFSIDEFPQLINVLVGQMSLVGPRPPIPSEVEEYSWEQRRRLSVRPGITGLWQVSGRSEVSFDDWVRLDLQYIDTWSLLLDFNILWRTYGAVMRGRGAS